MGDIGPSRQTYDVLPIAVGSVPHPDPVPEPIPDPGPQPDPTPDPAPIPRV